MQSIESSQLDLVDSGSPAEIGRGPGAPAHRLAQGFNQREDLFVDQLKTLSTLAQSEERFRRACEDAAIGMALVALDGRWMKVNRSLCETVGFTEAELLATRFQAITHPDDLDADLALLQQLIRGDIRTYQMIKRYIHKRGSVVWIQLHVSLVRDEKGTPLYLIAQIQDITERKKTEDALRASEEAYRTTFELAGVGMAHLELSTGEFRKVNQKLTAMLGYSADELLKRGFREIAHPQDLHKCLDLLESVSQHNAMMCAIECRCVRKDGQAVWTCIDANSIGSDGSAYIIMMFRDVTDQRRVQEALRLDEKHFRTLASHTPVAIFQTDTLGNNIFVNDRWCQLTGFTADAAKGSGWKKAVHPDDLEHLLREQNTAAQAGCEYAAQIRYLTRDQKVIWVHVSCVLVRDDAGHITGSLGTVIDVTERKRAEELETDRREVLELVAQDSPLNDVMNRIARMVERQADDCLAMMTVLTDGNVLLHAPSLASPLVERLQHGLLPLASSLTGGAWQSSSGVGTSDIDDDPHWHNVRHAAEAAGLTRCWTMPITSSENSSHGAVSLLCRHKRTPTATESEVLAMVTRLAAISIERSNTTKQFTHMVRHDRLTGLPNRMLFEDRIEQAMSMSRRSGKPLALMLLDLDEFKKINDSLGHHAGDQMLQLFTQRLRTRLRETDTMARIGGDEFVILLPEITEADHVEIVAQKLIDALVEPFDIAEQLIVATASIGIALFPRDADDALGLQQKADAALYRMKERGRNGYSF